MVPSSVDKVLRQARRRALGNIIAEEGAHAAVIAFGGLLILLLLGKQVLDWQWPALLSLGGVAFAAWRTRRRRPSLYAVAQHVDDTLNLHDTLSTALHFSGSPAAGTRVGKLQREQAGRVAESVDPGRAIPLRLPRAIFAALALFLAAGAVFAFRYTVRKSLDLRAPAVEGIMDTFPGPLARDGKPRLPVDSKTQELLQKMGLSLEDPGNESEIGPQPTPDSLLATIEPPDVNQLPANEETDERAGRKGPSDLKGASEGEPGEHGENASASSEETGSPGTEESPGRGQSVPQSSQQSGRQQQNAGDNSSVLDKMRDALANLLAKLKIPQGGQDGRQMQAPSQNSRQPGSLPQGSRLQGQNPQNQQPQGAGEADPQSQAQGEGQQAEGMKGNPGDRNADSSSQEAKSGMGKQDGSKDIKLAEQAAAMGKISEVLGKRAANITGEVMVEVRSGKQQLRTPYSPSAATHGPSSGEISRDQIPLQYQHYVQQYFEEVRKSAARQ